MDTKKQAEIFSKNLQRELRKNNIPQNEIAKSLGVNLKTFNGWVHGVSTPRFNKLQSLCEYLDISMEALIEENYEESKERQLLRIYNKLDVTGKEKLFERADELNKLHKLEKDN